MLDSPTLPFPFPLNQGSLRLKAVCAGMVDQFPFPLNQGSLRLDVPNISDIGPAKFPFPLNQGSLRRSDGGYPPGSAWLRFHSR